MEIQKANEKIDELVLMALPDEDTNINNDSEFGEDGVGADSLAMVETLFRINEEFDIEIEDEVIEDIETLGHLKICVISESNKLRLADARQIGLDESKLEDIRQ